MGSLKSLNNCLIIPDVRITGVCDFVEITKEYVMVNNEKVEVLCW